MSERSAAPVGVLLGVVLLGAVAAFGIALPEATGDDEKSDATAAEIELPDTLPHGLVAQDNLDSDFAARYLDAQESAVEGFTEIFGVPAAVRGYAAKGGRVQATITVLDTAPGLFDPHGPPIDPAVLGLERSVYELKRVGDAVCDVYWQQTVPEGQPVDQSVDPAAVQCQLGDGDRTIELFGSGMSLSDATDVLEALVSGN
jgi:hypothetical protein